MSTESLTNNKVSTGCNCSLCVQAREVYNQIESLPVEKQEFFKSLFDLYLEVSSDLDYWKAKARGQI